MTLLIPWSRAVLSPRMLLLLALLSVYAIAADDFNCNYGHMNKLWTPEERKAILEVHNEMRKKLREGKYVAGDGKSVPFQKKPAAKKGTMPDLIYNCTIEESAQRWANKCAKMGHSPGAERPGYAESLAIRTATHEIGIVDFGGKAAGYLWEEEFIKNGWPSNLWTNTMAEIKISHAVQMVWAKTTHVGCGLKRCSKAIWGMEHEVIVVCQYFPSGNHHNQYIYEEDPDWTDSSPSKPGSPPSQQSLSDSTPSQSPSTGSSPSQLPLLCALAFLTWYWLCPQHP